MTRTLSLKELRYPITSIIIKRSVIFNHISAINYYTFIVPNRIYHITITEKFWDQYGKQYHNEELKEKIKFNDQIKVNGGLGDELTFRVIKVNNDSITIKTSEKMSQIKIDLLSTDDEFVIKKGEETVINRLVMDGGVSYTIKLER